jgi:hypothetical protein
MRAHASERKHCEDEQDPTSMATLTNCYHGSDNCVTRIFADERFEVLLREQDQSHLLSIIMALVNVVNMVRFRILRIEAPPRCYKSDLSGTLVDASLLLDVYLTSTVCA